MLNEKMVKLGKNRSVIREIFEYGNKRRKEIGEEKLFDFSLGNPSIPAPANINQTLLRLICETDPVKLHGYTSAQGDFSVRSKIAQSINKRFDVNAVPDLIYMTCGAAAALTISLTALVNEGDEVIVLAPFFPEYRVFAEKAGARLVVVKCREDDFQIDFNALESAITERTKAIIINSPNNPTGVVLSKAQIERLSALLTAKQCDYNNDIYIICDEPYRELSYGAEVPYIPQFYENSIVCYSYSKSLSLPGERIGYIFVSPKASSCGDVYAGICGAGRALGFVCAPSLLQYAVAECESTVGDISAYRKNRDLLYKALCEYGYTCIKPDGAFYLFVKSPEKNANAFCERAKEYELLLVPSDDFGIEGYVRISYCVSFEQIEKSLPAFRALMEEYKK